MRFKAHSCCAVTVFAVIIVLAGCSGEEAEMPSGGTLDYRQTAREFAESLATRDYPTAYSMMLQKYREQRTAEELQAAFETIVPTDWGPMGPIEVVQTMDDWPGKQPLDIGWVYVSVGGDVYSEAVTVVVTSENGEAKIREVEFGRP